MVSTFCTKPRKTTHSMPETESVSHDQIPICACGGQKYKARHAIDGAVFRGDLETSWQEFLVRLKAQQRAEELELESDDDAIANAAEEFRYQHDLITAEETEHWLGARGLTLDDFSDYFARQHWPGALEDEIEADAIDFASAPTETRDLFFIDLILSGQLDRFATDLMWRLASVSAKGENEISAESIEAERQAFFDRHEIKPKNLEKWLQERGRDAEWFEAMLKMETAFQQEREALLSPQARKKELAMLRMPLTRFDAEVIEVESMDAAKEAIFCIREDGMSMEEVAAEARYPYRTISFLRQEVPAEMEQQFLSIAAGDILDPLARGDGFELYRITNKVEPDPDDPAIQEHIDQRLSERHFFDLTNKHVEARLPSAASAE
jgi:hypothetical protein